MTKNIFTEIKPKTEENQEDEANMHPLDNNSPEEMGDGVALSGPLAGGPGRSEAPLYKPLALPATFICLAGCIHYAEFVRPLDTADPFDWHKLERVCTFFTDDQGHMVMSEADGIHCCSRFKLPWWSVFLRSAHNWTKTNKERLNETRSRQLEGTSSKQIKEEEG